MPTSTPTGWRGCAGIEPVTVFLPPLRSGERMGLAGMNAFTITRIIMETNILTPHTPPAQHLFDQAIALEATGSPNIFRGHVSQNYWFQVGPWGGITAATQIQAILQHPQCLGDPVSITINYAAPVGAGDLEIEATPSRTNRSTQHWILITRQADDSGTMQVVTTATAVTAVRRPTWSGTDMPMPEVTPAAQVERAPAGSHWVRRYDMRYAKGYVPPQWDGAQAQSLTQVWIRDDPPRQLDFPALAAVCDVFFPRIWLRRAQRVAAGTVSITIYFHANRDDLAAAGSGPLLAQACGQEFRNNFGDHAAQVWSQVGQMLATSHQVIYYKE